MYSFGFSLSCLSFFSDVCVSYWLISSECFSSVSGIGGRSHFSLHEAIHLVYLTQSLVQYVRSTKWRYWNRHVVDGSKMKH